MNGFTALLDGADEDWGSLPDGALLDESKKPDDTSDEEISDEETSDEDGAEDSLGPLDDFALPKLLISRRCRG